MKKKLAILVLFFLILFSSLAADQLKVGFYDNPPKIYRDKQGNAAGFWADITSEIATREEYEIKWVFGSWEECLQNLEKGEIDLLPDVSYTKARAEKFLFANETSLLSWSRIYIHSQNNLSSIMDLENKKIAALKSSVNLVGKEGIRDLLQQFNLKAEIIQFPDYQSVFKAIEDKAVFAGVSNKDVANRLEKSFKVKRIPLIFQPADLRFAFSPKSAYLPDVIKQFDQSISELKNDSSSLYYHSMEKHLGETPRQSFIPFWLKISLAWGIFFLLLALILIIILNRKLLHKVTEADKLNQEWETTFNSISDHIWILDKDQKISKINHPYRPTLDLPLDNILGKHCHNIVHEQDYPVEECPLKRSIQSLKRETMELRLDDKWFKVIADPLLDDENQFLGAVHIIQDITQTKKIIEELRATNQQLSASEQELMALNQELEASEQQLMAANQQLAAHEKQLMETNFRLCKEINSTAETQKQLSQQLATKKTLLKELFHRTKNNMQIISSMLGAELRKSDNAEQTKTLTNIRNKIYALSLVQSQLYESDNLSEINLKNFISELVQYLIQHFLINTKKIKLDLQLQDVILLIDYALPIGLVINEIISNIFMHAFPNQVEGQVKIVLEKKADKIFLNISDNGIGVPEKYDLSASESVGLHNIFNLVKYQLKGDITYHQENGLAWQISFKSNSYRKRV